MRNTANKSNVLIYLKIFKSISGIHRLLNIGKKNPNPTVF